jgi:hypothetical protein
MAKDFHFLTRCIEAQADELHDMDDRAIEITYGTFMRHVDRREVEQYLPATYEQDARRGLTLKNDYAVRYYRSVFRGKRCYGIDHSSIDHIFVE